jgi:hypothetical protein
MFKIHDNVCWIFVKVSQSLFQRSHDGVSARARRQNYRRMCSENRDSFDMDPLLLARHMVSMRDSAVSMRTIETMVNNLGPIKDIGR